jgi:CheY-like chemotaxis protein
MCKLLNQSKPRKVSISESEKILVIDDDPIIRNNMLRMLKSIMRKFTQLRILEGDDGTELINLVQDNSENLIKLIFTDENMTKVEGSEAVLLGRSS